MLSFPKARRIENVLKKLVVYALFLALTLAMVSVLPRPVAAQLPTGPYADELIYSVVPLDQAVSSVAAGDSDIYMFSLADAADKTAARDNPNINSYESYNGLWNILVNPVPHGAGVSGINVMAIQDVREALNWLFDRNYIATQIMGGFAVPHTLQYFSQQPDYVREYVFMSQLERQYAYDPQKAVDQITAALSGVSGITFEGGKWKYQGADIVVRILQRVTQPRFDIGAYMATQMESIGFTTVLDPVPTGSKAYSGDPEAGVWHLYTEGWGLTGFLAFDDGNADFFYNGDFGSAIWQVYRPPAELTQVTQALYLGQYSGLEERQELIRKATELGVEDSVRIFLVAEKGVFPVNKGTTDLVFDVFAGLSNWFSLKTARKGGTTGGTIKITQPQHSLTPWNYYAGFDYVYENNQLRAFADPGVIFHPHTGSYFPYRANFVVDTLGPFGQHDLPATALTYDNAANQFVTVAPGTTAASKVTFTYTFGKWHSGADITMQDIVHQIAFLLRLAEGGDLYAFDPVPSSYPTYQLFLSTFKGFEVVDADTIDIYVDYWNIDPNTISAAADVWPIHSWEADSLMAATVLAGDAVFDEETALELGKVGLDLVKGASLPLLAAQLTTLAGAAAIPPGMDNASLGPGMIDSTAAAARWAAMQAWYAAEGHFLPSTGPFYIDGPINELVEQTVLKAFRTGYPFEVDKWDALVTPRVPIVALAQPPNVVQTFPATFSYTTQLGGQAYDRVTAQYIISDPGTGEVLLSGAAARTAPGTWTVNLSADETVKFVQGTYQFQAIVVGEEAAIPVVAAQDFTATSLSTALLTQIRAELDQRLAEVEDSLDLTNGTANDAKVAAQDAKDLLYIVLGVAIVAIALAAVNLVVMTRRLPRAPGPPKTAP